ncbi:hypothetical protein N7470_006867 [Penicillium chermesinum]|nr:hypothetical protein N7470_006867 [Penicillium chermesinum]
MPHLSSAPSEIIRFGSTPAPSTHSKMRQTKRPPEYYVVPVSGIQVGSRSSSEARSTPSSMMDQVPGNSAIPPYVDLQGSRSASDDSSSVATPVGKPRLGDINEAYLLRHFQRHLADWLDAGDPERRFAAQVARRASQSPLLLYACLAVAACHLSRTTQAVSPEVADSYHERCVSIMLPALENPEFDIGIDILLSSTVVLRFFEQLSSHTPSNDPQRHLLAGSVYISAHVDCAISGGLASASFWVFVIQDIQFALTYQKCLRLSFAPFDDRLRHWWAAKPVLSDGDWVNRAIWLLAETIDFCYNVNGRNFGARLGPAGENALKLKINDWEATRPDTFVPLHISPPDRARGKPFPVVLYTSLWHSTAMQHLCLAKVLLLIRELDYHEGGVVSTERRIKIKEAITENLNYLFGIALSADDEPSLRIMSCHAMFACSAWIDDPLARHLLFDLLRRTERDNGWPWAYVEQRILATWHTSPR